MKKVWIALLVLCCVALCACTAPHRSDAFIVGSDVVPLPEATPQPTLQAPHTPALPSSASVTSSTYRPEVVPSAFASSENFSTALYVLLTESIRAGEGDADASALSVTQEQFDGVRAFLLARNPWGTLTDITLDDVEPGRIVLTYSLDDPDECAAQAQRFDDAASAALSACVPENASQLTAASSLYKFVSQVISQNYVDENFEAADDGLYSALVDGEGVDRSFAYLYSFLLDQVGVENAVVLSETGEHAWNLLTIDGRSFYCDPQMEAGLSGGQSLRGFGLSGEDMAAFNGWETWTLENGAAQPETETLFPAVAQANFADVSPSEGALYFDAMDGRAGVFRMDLASGEVLDIVECTPKALAVLGENVYYLDSADNLLYSYNTADGAILQAVEGVPLRSMRRVGSELRYVTQEDESTESVISLN
ncbi:MAG: hypothetical protein ACOX83_08160 [Candidatus Spyradocola sp.]|jgi:hypothetical protein